MKSLLAVASLMLLALAGTASAQYNPDLAMSALMYCKASYCDYNQLPDWSCPTCQLHHQEFTHVAMFRNAGTQFVAYTGYNPKDDQVAVVFRGTNNIENWILDFEAWHVTYPPCKEEGESCHVHGGFHQAWDSLKDQIMGSLREVMEKTNPRSILVTGHSLGAAVSLLAALDITPAYKDKEIYLYNFGQPRVGGKAFVKYATDTLQKGRQFRVVHKEDPVPHVPPNWLFGGYLHVPHELWYDESGDGSWKDCKDSATHEDPHCSDSVVPWNVFDHVKYLGECVICEGKPGLFGICPLTS